MKMTMIRSSILRAAILAIGATALSALPAMAQDNGAPPPPPPGQMGARHGGMRGDRADFLAKKLNLTPDQVTQVKAIDADAWNQMKAMREDTTTAGQDKRAKMFEIHKASQDKIRALLTTDQQAKFDAMQAEMRARRGNREGRGGPGGPPPPPPTTPQL